MDLILTNSGTPFKTESAAKARAASLKKDGTKTEVVEHDGGFALARTEPRIVSERRKRIPLGERNRMGIRDSDKDPNFEYRVVNDDPAAPGRIQDFINAGWEKVKRSDIAGMHDQRTDVGTDLGSDASMPVGGNVRGVVMRIKKEWFEEDMQKKQEKLLKIESAIKKSVKKPGHYGAVKLEQRAKGRG